MIRPKYPDEVIYSIARVTLANARENVADLNSFGITAEVLTAFETSIETAAALPSGPVLLLGQKNLTGNKNSAIDACYDWGKALQTRLKFVFGRKSPQSDTFPNKSFLAARTSETRMAAVMEVLLSLAEQYQDALAAAGQTPEVIAAGRTLLTQMREAEAQQELKKAAKNAGNRKRYKQLDEIYETTNRVNEIGRLVFKNDPDKQALFKSRWPR